MFDLEKTTTELPLNIQGGERSAPPSGAVASSPPVSLSKRDLIEAALHADPTKSDRAIAKTLGVDHKTVGTARARLGIASPLGNSPPADISLASATDKAMTMIANLAKPAAPVVPEWDPFEPESEALVVPPQPAIAVYPNQMGTVTIRQPSDEYGEEDELIVIRPEYVEKLVARLRKVAAEMRE